MELTKFQRPQFIETLVFQVEADQVDRYLDLEYEIWTKELSKLPGFCGCEIWVSEKTPGEVTSHYFWESHAAFEGIDPVWLAGNKEKMGAAIEARFVRAGHVENPSCKVREYR